ncbi:fimbria/pilus outer membrane usher protein [Pantoea dispersa]|uniref:fimbria/pilus outer membrane usher protein n=1 Tax=Pantoea dispersa TaxID=59814 RepID=UPI0039B50E03
MIIRQVNVEVKKITDYISNRFRFYYSSQIIYRVIITGGFCLGSGGYAMAEFYFNPALLSMSSQDVSNQIADLSHFSSGSQAPGVYRVTLYINDRYVGEQNTKFIAGPDNNLLPEFTRAQYQRFGVRTQAVSTLASMPDDETIKDIRDHIPSARIDFLFSEQRLNLSIPQLLMERRARGEVDPASWDQGLPAALLNYAISGNRTRALLSANGGTSDTLYANLRGGLNLGAWRLRSYATFQQRTSPGQRSSDFNVISTYLQRDVHAIKGRVTLGDSATPADVFDSVQFRGGQLVSDDAMLPDSLRGFAPIVRGVSESGAEVTIRQNGSIIYQSYVPPGPFEINDLYPSSLSGDLEVTIKETDGAERTFNQAFSSVAVMQREGQVKYALTAGRLQSHGDGNERRSPLFVQGTLIYGLPRNFTLYGGIQLAQKYAAASAGVGVSLGRLGALSADVTQSKTRLPDNSNSQGQSYRLRYSRSILETGTSVSLAAYRYSTQGYYSLRDATIHPDESTLAGMNSRYRPRSELQVMLNQSLGDAGSLYLTGSQRDFWAKQGALQSWTLGYNTSWLGSSYGLNFTQAKDTSTGKRDQRVAFNVSIPLNKWLPDNQERTRNNMQMNYGLTNVKEQGTTQLFGLSGTALDGSQLSYNLSHAAANHSNASSSSLSATYRGGSGLLSGGYNRNRSQEQINYGLRGGVVAHPYGLTLSQELGETVALVQAPGASGVKVNNQTGVTTDWRGYAVLPWVTPYRRTDISLEPDNLKADVAMTKTSVAVTPTRGALVLAAYPTQQGLQLLMTLKQQNGQPVPFGAVALLDNGDELNPNTSIVGDDGLMFMAGMPNEGRLLVQWGKDATAQCKVPFRLNPIKDSNVPVQAEGICHQ